MQPLALGRAGRHLLLHGVLGLESLQLLRGRTRDFVGWRHILLLSVLLLVRRRHVGAQV